MKLWRVLCGVVLVVLGGCGGRDAPKAPEPKLSAIDAAVKGRWGTTFDALPELQLVIISPHNENIQYEFERAFAHAYALQTGKRVDIEWRDVGGGASTILQYLRNVYARADSAGVDIIWGGGETVFQQLAAEGILVAMQLQEGADEHIPETFGGVRMMDPQRRWCGSAVSGFGILYNRDLLRLRGVKAPAKWADLGDPAFHGLLALADPTQSGSAAAAYEMIVQSSESWPAGWARLLNVLANATRFHDSAGDAANAPVLGEAAAATCIDFYGALRVAEAPKVMVYVSPKGETAFSPDPIAILKGPPHAVVAQHFVDFVLSARGQALWALDVGAEDGPVRNALGRQPIRRDVYLLYRNRFLPWIVNPYEAGDEMKIDVEMKQLRDPVLKHLIRAAAIDNLEGLQAAREALVKNPTRTDLAVLFAQLPPDVLDRAGIKATAEKLADPTQAELIVSNWQRFFRNKYDRMR